jgi:hypothetical protein
MTCPPSEQPFPVRVDTLDETGVETTLYTAASVEVAWLIAIASQIDEDRLTANAPFDRAFVRLQSAVAALTAGLPFEAVAS